MEESLFWQEGFPKERRADLVAELLFSRDPNARIPNNEGLRPERVEDFYRAVAFTDAKDFDARMAEVREKYRRGEPKNAEVPEVLEPMSPPAVDPFEEIFADRDVEMVPALEEAMVEHAPAPVALPPAPRVRAVEAPRRVVRKEVKPVAEVIPVYPEDRVSALARRVRSWFGGQSRTESAPLIARPEIPTRDQVVGAVVALVRPAEGTEDLARRRTRANIDASERLERAIGKSKLPSVRRDVMKTELRTLRDQYESRVGEIERIQERDVRGEIESLVDAQANRWGESAEGVSALRVIALRPSGIAQDIAEFRGHLEGRVAHGGGTQIVEGVEQAFREAWETAWAGATQLPLRMSVGNALETVSGREPSDGVIEDSLPGLRAVAGGRRGGVGELVIQARLSLQDDIDRALPPIERAMKRAA